MLVDSISYCVTDYNILTNYSFKFTKKKDGYYSVFDRGIGADRYQSNLKFYGTLEKMESLKSYIKSIRETNYFVFETELGEQFFGSDIDYTGSQNALILKFGDTLQKTWKGYSLELLLEIVEPSFTGSATLPDLKYSEHSFNANANYTRNFNINYKLETSDETTYTDNLTDTGHFNGTFYFNDSQMRNLRRFYASNRGAAFYINSISGVIYPFGKRRNIVFPARVKMIGMKEKYVSPNRWKTIIKLAEDN